MLGSRHALARLVAALVAVGATGLGCGGQSDSDAESIGTVAEAIAGGYGDVDDTGVIGLVITDGAGGKLLRTCSGTLISPNLVLTAQHCVATTAKFVVCESSTFGPAVAADQVYVTTGTAMWSSGTIWRSAREVLTPPGGNGVCGRDMALVILSEPVAAEEATAISPRLDHRPDLEESYSAIGYGSTGQDTGDGGYRRRRDGLIVTCVGETCESDDYIAGHEWRGDHGICNGDSGGPALDADNRVIGVTSRGPMGCDDPIYGGLTGWRDWIRDVGARAADEGDYAPPAWLEAKGWDPSREAIAALESDSSCAYGGGAARRGGVAAALVVLGLGIALARRRAGEV